MPEVLIDADPPPAWLSPAESSPTGSRLDLDRAVRALRDQLSETRRRLARREQPILGAVALSALHVPNLGPAQAANAHDQ